MAAFGWKREKDWRNPEGVPLRCRSPQSFGSSELGEKVIAKKRGN